jgi:hypothetical protein
MEFGIAKSLTVKYLLVVNKMMGEQCFELSFGIRS